MLDPFPAPPDWLTPYTEPIAGFLNLPTLPLHAHEVLLAAIFYHVLFVAVAPFLSRTLIPNIYSTFNARTRLNWNVHVVSFVQSIIVSGFALWVMRKDDERSNLDWQGRVWGYTGATGAIQALGAGYFLWDFFMCARYIKIFGWGMLAHGISALVVFSLGFRPFVNFYAPTFILYELSSPFLNIHWALDKLRLTGSIYQLLNGIVLIFTFFSARIIWGTYSSILVFSDVYTALSSPSSHIVVAPPPVLADDGTIFPPPIVDSKAEVEVLRFAGAAVVPLWLAVTYLLSNLVLNGLNWYWFTQMIKTIRARFEPGAQKVAAMKEKENAPAAANGTVTATATTTGAAADGDVRARR